MKTFALLSLFAMLIFPARDASNLNAGRQPGFGAWLQMG
jgi:hypothetical protein